MSTNLKPSYIFRHAYREITKKIPYYYKSLEIITNDHMMSYKLL